VCAGCPEGNYKFLRDQNGAETYFLVNGAETQARGITDSGVIVGFFGQFLEQGGFVTTLAASPQFQAITVPAEQLLSYPGAVFTAPEGFIATKH